MKDILIILPTRNRPDNVRRFYEAWKATTDGSSDVVLMADITDPNDYSYTGWIQERHKRLTPIQKVNMAAKKYHKGYKVIAFIGDDAIIETKDFEHIIMGIFGDNKFGVLSAYNHIPFPYPDHPFITIGMYELAGYFWFPKFFHSWADYAWHDVGMFLRDNGLGVYCQTPLVSIRNMHPYHVEGVKEDDNYRWLYRENVAAKDKVVFDTLWQDELQKLKIKIYEDIAKRTRSK